MGLAIYREIIEAHWGSVTARNTVGQVAALIVTLPSTQPMILAPTQSLPEALHGGDY